MRSILCWVFGSGLYLMSAQGCSHISPAEAALLMTGIAAGASAARRADGDCYTWCAKGTRCNRDTGLCEPLPCQELCKPGEVCDASGAVPRCVPDRVELEIRKNEIGPPSPFVAPPPGELPPRTP